MATPVATPTMRTTTATATTPKKSPKNDAETGKLSGMVRKRSEMSQKRDENTPKRFKNGEKKKSKQFLNRCLGLLSVRLYSCRGGCRRSSLVIASHCELVVVVSWKGTWTDCLAKACITSGGLAGPWGGLGVPS